MPYSLGMQLENIVTESSATLDRMFFSFNGRSYERTSYNGKRPEMYVLDDSDGIYSYIGDTFTATRLMANAKITRRATRLTDADALQLEIGRHWSHAFDR